MADRGCLPVEMHHSIGVDKFKPFVPEYQLINGVGDGRASLTVQSECQESASALFTDLLEEGQSFIWDSSMSDREATLGRMHDARERGYLLTMIAVLTPVEVAVRQAMKRAMLSRRFPNPQALPKSHRGFRQAFEEYIPLFDQVTVFANEGAGSETA